MSVLETLRNQRRTIPLEPGSTRVHEITTSAPVDVKAEDAPFKGLIWARAFFHSLSQHGNASRAAKHVGKDLNYLYRLRRNRPPFARLWRKALARADQVIVDAAEDALKVRGIDGIERPIVKNGEIIGYDVRYSDKCLEMLLKSRRPKKYDRARGSSLTINNNQQITAEVRIAMLLDPEKRKAACDLAAIVAAPRAIQGPPSVQPPCMPPSGPADGAGE